ncbi:MAG TPA: hypothetical protein VFD90_15535 [Gaiellales bacterium]|nr:hypothetical protein [Gaiellales bacterium]
MPHLRTPRLAIRPPSQADEAACRAVLEPADDAAFARWLTWAVAAPAALAELSQPPYGERAVVLAATAEVVGLVALVPSLGPFAQLEGAAPGGRGRRSSASTGRSRPFIAVRAMPPRPRPSSRATSSGPSTLAG